MRDFKKELENLCNEAMDRLNLCFSPEYVDRLKLELKHIGWQDEYQYFVELYDQNKKLTNENNLLVPYLLGIVDEIDINKLPNYIFISDFPDVDVDYIPEIQQWLKNEWAPATFGAEYVCNIGNYSTYGIKSAMQDMARVHGLSHGEIIEVTTNIEDKDEENNPISWETALEINKGLAEYCEKYPDVYDAAKRLYGRIRGQGKHAGGLIISKSRLDELVPLTVDKNGHPLSAWTEGLHAQDLAPVGLVKFDILVITNLVQIAQCLRLIRERHGIDRICALTGGDNWSDTSYLNDPKAIELANNARLKCIFQFDSAGIRDLAKKGGVTSFEDLVAYTSLYRPGPMSSNLNILYCKRKKGEKYEIHPLLKPILESTYGLIIFQEQVMKIFNVVGGFPLPQCYKIVKAISKKKGEVFEKASVQFIEQCQNRLGYSKEQADEFFLQIQRFSGYAFNFAHATAYTFTSSRLLYLKAHYPLEFFAAILSCEKDANKIKEYKLDAERFGIPINRIDLNKSKVHFSIVDDKIYLGFADIKGIGDEAAKRIVNGQPYTSFEDFLERCGTDANILKPLISLRVFKGDPAALYKFAEYYKEKIKSRGDRDKRFVLSQQKRLNDKLVESFNKAKVRYEEKVKADKSIIFEYFVPTGDIDPKMKEIFSNHLSIAENRYYGFPWDYIITQSPDYRGLTFEVFDVAAQERDAVTKPVEVQVVEKPKKIKSKKGNIYYKVKVMDGEGRVEMITVWNEDFEIFKEEFEAWDPVCQWGNLLKIRLKRPVGEYRSYTFDSPPKELRWKLIPPEKEKDLRLTLLRLPETKKDAIDLIKEEIK